MTLPYTYQTFIAGSIERSDGEGGGSYSPDLSLELGTSPFTGNERADGECNEKPSVSSPSGDEESPDASLDPPTGASAFAERRRSQDRFLNLDILYVQSVLHEEASASSSGSASPPYQPTCAATLPITEKEAGRQDSEPEHRQGHQSEAGVVLRSFIP